MVHAKGIHTRAIRKVTSMMGINSNHWAVRYIVIYESELRVLAGLAAESGNLEFAGALYVLWTRDGMPVVFLATTDGSGPARKGPAGTIHRWGYCEISPKYFQNTTLAIEGAYGVKLGGFHHRHPGLGMEGPSGPDTSRVVSIMRKNRLNQLISIITTTADGGGTSRSHRTGRSRRTAKQEQAGNIRINAFLYCNPDEGHYQRVDVKVLPGISPLRLAILAGGPVDMIAIGEHARAFPLDRVVVDAADPDGALPCRGTPELESLSEQIRRVPEAARERIDVSVGSGTVTLDIPLPAGPIARIIVDEDPPHVVRRAGLKGDQNSEICVADMLHVGDGDFLLERAYALLAAHAQRDGTNVTTSARSNPRQVRSAFDVRRWLDAAKATSGGVYRVAKRLVQGLRSRRAGAGAGRCDDVDPSDRDEWEAR